MAETAITSLVEQVVRDVKGSWRYRWPALAVSWAACVLGAAVVLSLPDVYQANARVFVDTSSRLRDVLGTIAFEPDIESRVNIVRQAMLGRPQLEKVATETGLILQAESGDDRERLMEGLLDKITISVGRSNIDRNLFRITYENADRSMSVAVVDALLNAFVEDVLQQKARGADAAQQFLRDQIEHYSEQLVLADQRLAVFKRTNVGLLPGEGGDYFGSMQRELAALEQLKSDLRVAQSKREELQQQLGGDVALASDGSAVWPAGIPGAGLDTDVRIAQLETALDDLLLRYTDQHPEVMGLKEQLVQLRERRTEQLRSLAGGGLDGGALANSPVYQSVQIALNAANVDVAALRAQIADGEAKVAQLRERLDTMPEVEAELARLTRDYANTKALYDQLVGQLERERLVNEGDEREVVNFQIIDPPSADLDPIAPQRMILLLGALLFGVSAGGGLAYLLNVLKPVFIDAAQLRLVSGLPVVGVVSMAWSSKASTARHFGSLIYFSLVVCLLAAGGATIALRESGAALVQQLL